MSGFHPCNPQCGWCRPPKLPMRVCESCGWPNPPEEEVVVCSKCGGPLPEIEKPVPIHCLQIDEICMNPCGKGSVAPRVVIPGKVCLHHTPQPSE